MAGLLPSKTFSRIKRTSSLLAAIVDTKRLAKSLEIGAIPVEEAVEWLLLQAGLEKTEENVEHAKAITDKLGGLVLAIDQAAT